MEMARVYPGSGNGWTKAGARGGARLTNRRITRRHGELRGARLARAYSDMPPTLHHTPNLCPSPVRPPGSIGASIPSAFDSTPAGHCPADPIR
jgi:hypothetical protein